MNWLRSVIPVAACLSLSACTHLTPYYRWDQKVRTVPPVTDAEIDHRVLLVGDAGDPDPKGEPLLDLLAYQVNLLPTRTTVVFLGDNVYQRGMPKPISPGKEIADDVAAAANVVVANVFESRQDAERRVNAQIDVVRGTQARAIFIPGNHDWDQFEVDGWDRIRNLEDYIKGFVTVGTADIVLLPPGGCPGPTVVALGRRGQLIVLDTEWWLDTRADGKPTPDNNPTGCEHTTERDIRAAVRNALIDAAKDQRWVVVVGHHPLLSEGPHGGFSDARTQLFPFRILRHYVPFYIEWLPLPGLGSLVAMARKYFSPSPQDIGNDRNRHMRNALLEPMIKADTRNNAAPLVYAAGHDHSLQVFEKKTGPRYVLVSGLGSSARASDVSDERRTLFAHANPANPGFIQLDFLKRRGVRMAVIERTAEHTTGEELYSKYLAPLKGAVVGK